MTVNPTALANDAFAIGLEISRLRDEKSKLIAVKKDAEIILSELKGKLRETLPMDQYRQYENRRNQKKKQIRGVEKRMDVLTSELSKWYALEAENRASLSVLGLVHADDGMITARMSLEKNIEALRNRYLSFAEDQTRVNSMRVMAAEFANHLTAVLRGKLMP